MQQITGTMNSGVAALTEREKETLRLLVAGHDAKSIASHLGLSVHTINERLRDARRKLEVSSSREAARLLAEREQAAPDSSADKFLGVSGAADPMASAEPAGRRKHRAQRLAWFGGGMLIMSLVIAAVALSSVFGGSVAATQAGAAPAVAITAPSASASLEPARAWLALVDGRRWDDSWRSASSLFTSQITAPQWARTIESVRGPLGAVSKRTFQTVTKTDVLPGAPAGAYEVILFRTDFARKPGATETVIMVRDPGGWRVAGYFIR
ncbi:DUF4019 domain-containing protein [Sphingosinicella sp. BN140058]|uniref:helix-turn-helix domain-containing protein n=1 Tax=Sphingosinicella sp. BN140058 TaxID=1892855 RepID=UPI0010139EFD|nr:DUF4019 domain-containing protein [Sphingosinicella sp. BN140058]QAY76123.1 DUF4019 domain-containing protein [Sphingosinicella sp. BN140058]